MSKYMYLFRGGNAKRAELSPEAMQEHMQEWRTWMGGLADSGKLVDGLPLNKEGKVVTGNNKVITDGPFVETKEIVGGYLIVNAETLDEATEISLGCPIFVHDDGTVEVREIMNM